MGIFPILFCVDIAGIKEIGANRKVDDRCVTFFYQVFQEDDVNCCVEL